MYRNPWPIHLGRIVLVCFSIVVEYSLVHQAESSVTVCRFWDFYQRSQNLSLMPCIEKSMLRSPNLPPCPDEADLLRQQLREACGCKRWEFDNLILGSPHLLLGAREIGRSWWCFDSEDIFFLDPLPAICILNSLKTLDRMRSQRIRANEREYVPAQDAKSCYFLLSRLRSILKSWSFIVTSQYFFRSTSLIFSACPICSISLSFGSVEAELRVEYDGLAAANEVVDFVAPACRDHPVTILDPCCEAIRKELAATRSRTLAEFWVSWDGPSWSTWSRCHSCWKRSVRTAEA